MAQRILVVDDDPLICKGLKYNLEQEGYQVFTATNSRSAIDQIHSHPVDAAVLDIGLPGENGLSLCQYIKAHYRIPVIFLTARRKELDEIVGLEIGADDYITKPFNIGVFLAHLRAVLRRDTLLSGSGTAHEEPIQAGMFYLDPAAHNATRDQKQLNLAPREFDLLHFFLMHPNHVFTADEIIERVWGAEFIGEPQVLYVQIRGLRENIEEDPSEPAHLITIRGVGYKFLP